MERYVPIGKRSKKEQKEFYAAQRNTWNGLNPVTRTVPNGKGYDRNKMKNEERRNSRRSTGYEPTAVFCLCRYMSDGKIHADNGLKLSMSMSL